MNTLREPASLSVLAALENLEAMQAHLAGCAVGFGLEARRTDMLSVALEEIFVNICEHAYPAGPGPVVLNCRAQDDQFVVEVIDEGQAFDPDSVAEPDLDADLETRRIGGLGWFLVRRIADRLECFRQDGRNIVRLTMNRQT